MIQAHIIRDTEIRSITVPSFTYTGKYQVLKENKNDWIIRFLTSGTLRFNSLPSNSNFIDICIVGGGGGGIPKTGSTTYYAAGGGGGYVNNKYNCHIAVNTDYEIVIGEGGASKENGQPSSAFGFSAQGGYSGVLSTVNGEIGAGGNGGSGGAGGGATYGGWGGLDGFSASNCTGNIPKRSGQGQREQPGENGETGTTREFGEFDGIMYGGGGAAGNAYTCCGSEGGGAAYGVIPVVGVPNTGGGGSATNGGGSGIVCIRNHRNPSITIIAHKINNKAVKLKLGEEYIALYKSYEDNEIIKYSCILAETGNYTVEYLPSINAQEFSTYIVKVEANIKYTLDLTNMLPQGYKKVEWIACDGTNYFDTGVAPIEEKNSSIGIKVKCKQAYAGSNLYQPIFGTSDGNGYFNFLLYNLTGLIGVNKANVTISGFPNYPGRVWDIDFNNDKHQVIINQQVVYQGEGNVFFSPSNIVIGAQIVKNIYYSRLWYYSVQIYENNTSKILRNLIPCCQEATGLFGFYDTIYNIFLEAAGAGMVYHGKFLE